MLNKEDRHVNKEWNDAYDGLISEMSGLGFSEELVVDEMLAIMSEIAAWREKKASEGANAAYNDMLYFGLARDEG